MSPRKNNKKDQALIHGESQVQVQVKRKEFHC